MKIPLSFRGRWSTLFLIIYIWFGMIYSRVSYHFGGVVLIAIGYLLLCAVLFPWKIQFDQKDDEIVMAIKCFLLFACVVVVGTEVFQRYTSAKWFGSIRMGVDTFHMIKSFPIWLAFLLIKEF